MSCVQGLQGLHTVQDVKGRVVNLRQEKTFAIDASQLLIMCFHVFSKKYLLQAFSTMQSGFYKKLFWKNLKIDNS